MNRIGKAHKCYHKGDYEKALMLYKMHIEEYGNDPVILYFIGVCLMKLERYDELKYYN